MRKRPTLWLAPLALMVMMCGCHHDEEDPMNTPVKPPGDSPYNNNAPGAKDAPPAPGPPEGVPRPGGGKHLKGG
jgi:hypothetical protein